MDELNADGSIKGKSFSPPEYTGGYPHPNAGETYKGYRKRVDELKALGFHLGDLSWDDWDIYCRGSGSFSGCSGDEIIGTLD